MFLMYYEENGKRIYTFSKVDPAGNPTKSAHPARFSPQDQFSKQRILLKQRFGILPTQTEESKAH